MGFPIVEIRIPQLIGDHVEIGKPIASVVVGDELQNLSCNISVIIHELLVKANGSLTASQPLCRVLAEATEIPYGRPYARLEKVA